VTFIVHRPTYVSYIYIYMLVEQSGWGPSLFQYCVCVLAVLSPEAATHNINKYSGTQRNDARQFRKLPT
jgi:hypothetical protein